MSRPSFAASVRSFLVRRMVLTAVGVVVSGAAIILLAGTLDVGQTFAVLRRADPVIAVLAVGSLAVSILIRSARWLVLLPSGDRAVRLTAVVPVVLVGYLGNSIAPLRFGDALRAGVGARRFKRGTMEVLGSVITERLIDTAALAVVLVGVVAFIQGPAWLLQSSAVVAVACGLVGAIIYSTPSWAWRWSPSLGRLGGRMHAVIHHARRVVHGVRSTRRRVAAALGFSLLAWLIDGVTFWLCAQSLGFDLPWSITVAVAGSAALGMAAPSGPAAIGTFELAGTAAAVALGVPGESALALVIFGHVITVLPLVIGGGVSLALMRPHTDDRRIPRDRSRDPLRIVEPVDAER